MKIEVPTLTAEQLTELERFTTGVVAATAATMVMRTPFPACDHAHIMHVVAATAFFDRRYTPSRAVDFQPGWYFNSGESFDGPYLTQAAAEKAAKYMLKHWEDYCNSYSMNDTGLY
ncbi:MAG: hypothetical protein ACYTCN_02420 [Planctomycetota bacterium]|jgi:hypothetical protein